MTSSSALSSPSSLSEQRSALSPCARSKMDATSSGHPGDSSVSPRVTSCPRAVPRPCRRPTQRAEELGPGQFALEQNRAGGGVEGATHPEQDNLHGTCDTAGRRQRCWHRRHRHRPRGLRQGHRGGGLEGCHLPREDEGTLGIVTSPWDTQDCHLPREDGVSPGDCHLPVGPLEQVGPRSGDSRTGWPWGWGQGDRVSLGQGQRGVPRVGDKEMRCTQDWGQGSEVALGMGTGCPCGW